MHAGARGRVTLTLTLTPTLNPHPHPDQEREDEFDNVEVTHDKKVEDDKKLIDIVTRERSEVAQVAK